MELNVRLDGLTEMIVESPELMLTTKSTEGSCVRATDKVAVDPSTTIVAPPSVIFIVSLSTVFTVLVEDTSPVPEAVMITASEITFVSSTPVTVRVWDALKLDGVKNIGDGDTVRDDVFPDTKFTVRFIPGFPESVILRVIVPPSVTEDPPVKTIVGSSMQSTFQVEGSVIPTAEAVIVTISES